MHLKIWLALYLSIFISGAISVLSTYTDLTPKGIYYYMESNWGEGEGTGPDWEQNLAIWRRWVE